MVPQPGATTRLAPNRKLKVAYCVPHANVTGGLKMLLEQVRAAPPAGDPRALPSTASDNLVQAIV
jgi:hypothetical protein